MRGAHGPSAGVSGVEGRGVELGTGDWEQGDQGESSSHPKTMGLKVRGGRAENRGERGIQKKSGLC